MMRFVEGVSDTNSINFCPLCGEEIGTKHSDGTATCDSCKARVAVIEIDEDNGEEDIPRSQSPY